MLLPPATRAAALPSVHARPGARHTARSLRPANAAATEPRRPAPGADRTQSARSRTPVRVLHPTRKADDHPMNTTQHHSNGSSANGAASQRGKIYFGESTQIVTLETEPAQATQSEGNWGPQYTYRLAGNLITWLDPPQHQTLLELGAHAGDEVAFTKRKKGSRNVWDILRVEEEPAPAPPPSRFSTI